MPKSESGAGVPPNPMLEATGHGEAANGRIRVTVSVNGAHDAVEFDPRVMRQSADEIAANVREAMQAAHRQLFARLVAVDDESMAKVRKKVDDLQASYSDRMDEYQRMLDDIGRRRAR